jgi:hypothetical protein
MDEQMDGWMDGWIDGEAAGCGSKSYIELSLLFSHRSQIVTCFYALDIIYIMLLKSL